MIMRFPHGLRKALTLSYDDGVEQDERLMAILDRHGILCTFNLNSGQYAPEGHVWPAGQIHRRMSRSRVLALYGGTRHEVAVHCLNHANLPECADNQVLREVLQDRENLERDFGCMVRGMAYPFGTFNDRVVELLRGCGILYARTVISSHRYELPSDWLRLEATCHHDDPQLMALCDRFLSDKAAFSSKLFYLWGHAYEFEANDNWQVIEDFCEKMGGRDDVWYATNGEIVRYELAFRALVFSADGRTVYNPTVHTLWGEDNGKVYEIGPGATVTL